jgi:hypothetical protein
MAATANSWKLNSGKFKIKWFNKAVNTVISTGVMVELVAGVLVEATTTAGAADTPIVGVYAGPSITTLSSNYAVAEKLPVYVPVDPTAAYQGAVDTGTLVAASEGLSYDISATNGVTQSTSTNNAVLCLRYISASLGLFAINSLGAPR